MSAYDLHYKYVEPPFAFASTVFLDSGGYEASKDVDLSDLNERDYVPRTWTEEMHADVLANWNSISPTVIINYDHPNERLPIAEQIQRASKLAPRMSNVIREILLKPEAEGQAFIELKPILESVSALGGFDVVGVTEKELGNSILRRMESIARLRIGLEAAGLDIPIHVFGSLDTITTPMYFLAGADIFDGLTWLRFAYYEGYTMYKHNFGALELGVDAPVDVIDGGTWFHNYPYLVDLQLEMQKYLVDGDCASFSFHSDLFRRTLERTLEAVKE